MRHVVGDALVTLGADAGRPFHRGVGADLGLPLRAGLREIIREDERRAGTIRAVDDRDRIGRESCLGIELLDCRIVPALDFAQEHPGKRRSVEDELARRDAFEIDHRDHAAHHRGKLRETVLVELVRL